MFSFHIFFFFSSRRRHTRCSRDWSSDVCSSDLAQQIAGMNQGDLGSFQHIMEMAHDALKKSTSNLKHIIVFSDGDPGAPTPALMQAVVGDRITVSTVLISGHSPPDTMTWMAEIGKGRFYNVSSPNEL